MRVTKVCSLGLALRHVSALKNLLIGDYSVEKMFRISLVCLGLYGLLYWAVNNPKSAANVKTVIDNTADDVVDKAKDVAGNLTDK
jgi:hypothetical protein